MEKRDNRFLKGILAGVLASLVVVAAAVWGIYILFSARGIRLGTGSEGQVSDSSGIDYREINDKLDMLKKRLDGTFLYDMDEETMRDGIYKGFVASLGDPYTVYYTAEEYEALMESTNGEYVGIGVQFVQDPSTNLCTILRVFRGSGAEEAGLLSGDILYEVEGEDITQESSDNIVTKIRGEEGTAVKIRVYRPSTGDYVEVEVERRSVSMDTVDWKMLDGGIGYVQITEFDSVTYSQFTEALEDLQSQGMKGLLLDLRDNPGGLLDQVVEIADDFLDEGTIVSTRDKNDNEIVNSADSEVKYAGPIAILVNGNSASASEVLTGALKDYGLATVVGTTTFGKGIVQNIIPLGDGTAMKITTANYYTPNGTCIHGIGIEPDVEVQAGEGDVDLQLEKAADVLKEKIE